MKYTETLLLELAFRDVSPARIERLGCILGQQLREALDKAELLTERLETFFSTRRLVLITGRISCQQEGQIMKIVQKCLVGVIEDLKRSEQSFWQHMVSVLAFWGKDQISLPVGKLQKGITVIGAGLEPVRIRSAKEYWETVASHNLFIDNWERENRVRKLISEKQRELDGEVLTVPWFSQLLVSVEQPTVVVVDYSDEFLSLPEPLLIRVMEHNRLLPLVAAEGGLMNKAIALCDGEFSDHRLVGRGYSLALNGSLRETLSLYLLDLDIPPHQRVDMLKGISYLVDLGTLYDKQLRLQKLCLRILDRLDAGQGLNHIALQAARLCKTDLTTEICRCYPGTEGLMAELIINHFNELETVGVAVREHLAPRSELDRLPQTLVGAVLGIADRLDDICGFYHRGEIKLSHYKRVKNRYDDLIAIIASIALDASVQRLLKFSLSLYESQRIVPWRDKDLKRLMEIFQTRLGLFMVEQGVTDEIVAAILATQPDNVYGALKKVEILNKSDVRDLVTQCSQIVAVIDSACPRDFPWEEAAQEFLETAQEKDLFELFLTIKDEVEETVDKHHYDSGLSALARLYLPLIRFMTEVGISTDDQPLRHNRMCLIAEIRAMLLNYADFSLLKWEE